MEGGREEEKGRREGRERREEKEGREGGKEEMGGIRGKELTIIIKGLRREDILFLLLGL